MPRFTDAMVERLKPTDRRQELPDSLVTGLYLTIQPTGRKGWQVRYRAPGAHRRMTLGPYPLVSLRDAREKARDVLRQVLVGGDPAGEARAENAAVQELRDRDAIRNVVDQFFKRHGNQNRSAAETRAILDRELLPTFGDMPIGEFTRHDAVSILDAITDRGSPIAANRFLAHLKTLMTWAKGRGIIDASPVDGLKPPAKEVTRDRVLNDPEIRTFWQATESMGYPFGPMFRLLLLTGQRLNEVAGMRRNEIADGVWTIPGERAKNGNPHPVPLSPQARAILDGMPRIDAPYAFTTTGKTPVSGFSAAKRTLDRLMAQIAENEIEPWRVHDLRRTAATLMASLRIPPHVVEAVLNHRSGTIRGVAAVYNRFDYADEKREALGALASRIAQIVDGTAANVVRMEAGR